MVRVGVKKAGAEEAGEYAVCLFMRVNLITSEATPLYCCIAPTLTLHLPSLSFLSNQNKPAGVTRYDGW